VRSEGLPRRKPSGSRSKSQPPVSVEERQRQRDGKNRAKEEEKERKQRQREQDKAAKAREKDRAAALAEVNKVRTDKKVSTPEMIVDLPISFNARVDVQVKTLLEGLGVQHGSWESPVPNAIKWRRRVTSRFNDDVGYWEPCLSQIEAEHHVLVFIGADEFVRLALDEQLTIHVEDIQNNFPNYSVIYLIEGLTPWLRKNRNIRNRQFTSNVRAQQQGASAPTSTARRRNAAPDQEYICEDTIEDALLQLQVEHDVLIHHTTIPLETAQWIATFTQHISTIPYRKRRDENTLGAGFCMESGQVRTGDDAGDTFVRMLQEIVRVTAPIAYGVAAEFDTASKLVKGLETGGPSTLEGVRKSANKDGVFSDRTIGQAVSRRLHKVFTGRDETSTDV
jgi:crossover junction endonuclease EME1